MTEDQDNADEVVAGAVRVALTAAGQLAEQLARRREADLREAERDSAARVATLQSQLTAERELALQEVRDVLHRGDSAAVDDVVDAWEAARSWDDPTMGAERAQLEDRLRERFGVDAARLIADRSSGEQAVATAMVARDIDLQGEDAHHRGTAPNRVAALRGELVDAGVGNEAAAARALAAESHPTPVQRAVQRPGAALAVRPRGRRRQKAPEIQGPGR